jgi:hypothetical protein
MAQYPSTAEFDLTRKDHRDQFVQDGLRYMGSIGPYAQFKVTHENPRLLGPLVALSGDRGFAMLCTSNEYFSDVPGAPTVKFRLMGGADGNETVLEFNKPAEESGGCTGAADKSVGRYNCDTCDPTGGTETSGGEGGTPVTVTQPTPTGSTGDTTGGTAGTQPGSSGDCIDCGGYDIPANPDPQHYERISVEMPGVPVDSLILLRRVALRLETDPIEMSSNGGTTIHNQAHRISDACCRGDDCALDTPPAATSDTSSPSGNSGSGLF